MKRSMFGSLLFLGGMLFTLAAPAGPSLLAGPSAASPSAAPPSTLVPAAKQAKELATGGNHLANAAVKPQGAAASSELNADGSCPAGMVEVEGDYCPTVEQKCLRYVDPEGAFPRRCAEFAPTSACKGKTVKKHFCIDRYEWPNRAGEKPVVMKTWYAAKSACEGAGKRLCGDTEWTVACEGQERLPYPYGYERSAEACNIDKPHPAVDEKALANPLTRDAEAARLWQGEPSGSRDACVSPYGVFDMTGNVDEWVVNESGKPFLSGLKGGYWGPVRDRCRPMTTVHNEKFSFYQIGFRCCSDVPGEGDGVKAPTAPPAGKSVPSTNPLPQGLTGS
jgi:formylglycine-generating enzyme